MRKTILVLFMLTVQISQSQDTRSLTPQMFSEKLVPTMSENSGTEFGHSISLSQNRALVGAYRSDISGLNRGEAFIFEFDGTEWNQTKKLIPSDYNASSGIFFGFSVSLLGNRALVGAIGAYNPIVGSRSGAAYVFEYDGTDWVETAKLTASNAGQWHYFGSAVQLTADGGNRLWARQSY